MASRALIWLLVVLASGVFLFSGNNKANALLDVEWSPDPSMFPPGQIIAIDLGNTNSCVAGYSTPEHDAETMFRICIPSSVAFSDSDDGTVLVVGEDAMNHPAAIHGFKRLFGRRPSHAAFEAEEEEFFQRFSQTNLPYNVVEKDAHPHILLVKRNTTNGDSSLVTVGVEEVTLAVFSKLKAVAESRLGGGGGHKKVRAAIITLPYDCHTCQCRDAPLHAARLAGFEATRLLYEPIAAAVAYDLVDKQLREEKEHNVVVLHVGGGTAEATVMTFVDGVYEVIGARHDPFLGGQDFDQRVMGHFVQLIKEKHGHDIGNDSDALVKLRTACELAKKTLSEQDRAEVRVDSLVHGLNLSEPLTRAEFEELNRDLFLRVVDLVDLAVAGAETTMDNEVNIDKVVLVGGSTMIPKIQELVNDYFGGNKELNTRLKPQEAVAYGAALYSKKLYQRS
ncbi:hypothetical protein QOZ80_5BG0429870 [Eleusine coracana subsp. coracana]|nr:hypothetical protein QOZ80_5BG0429870 [Eleusine coracana subsp. coracana]